MFIKYSIHNNWMSGYYLAGKHFATFDGAFCELVEDEVFEVIRANGMTENYHLYSRSDNLTVLVKFGLDRYFTIAINPKMNSIWEDLNA